jgi:hypothetical protein
LRWLIEVGDTIPYWLTLGLVGFALVGVALLAALTRDSWGALRPRTLYPTGRATEGGG